MNAFKVNEYLTLKLENNRTNIYVKGDLFQQCKYLLLNIPTNEISSLDEIQSIDEAAEKLDGSLERNSGNIKIPYEAEFWAHCSNLQVWSENNYNTKLLHRNIAFQLLKKLCEVGDPRAKKVFKEEITKRLEKGNRNVIYYLTLEQYTNYLNRQELEDSLYGWQKRFEKWWSENTKYDDQYLSLNGCGILRLPEDIGSMKQLKYIDLEVNNLMTLPEELCEVNIAPQRIYWIIFTSITIAIFTFIIIF